MRERLTAAFVLLVVLVLVLAGTFRALSVRDQMRDLVADALDREAMTAAVVLADRTERGRVVREGDLALLVGPDTMLRYTRGDQVVEATGDGYDAGDEHVTGSATVDGVRVTARGAAGSLEELLRANLASLVLLLALLLLLAGALGLLAAGALAAPFQKLATAAGALSRGRFDIELPRTTIPEAVAISRALRISASHLEQSVVQDREFVRHASHVLRTPITGLRLELEDVATQGGVPDDVRAVLDRAVDELVRLDQVVGGLLGSTLGRQLAAGSETTVQEVATTVGERWRAALAGHVSLHVHLDEGEGMLITPGPVEQLLDELLGAVLVAAPAEVVLRFSGLDRHVRVQVRWIDETGGGAAPEAREHALARSRGLASAMGGRISGEPGRGSGLDVLLPRR